ncbi:MAG: redoxin domain-containing protein [Polyangiaceae bacterium]|nr:redoxin domain-containing protein [Polyangiaceae bacterium]
MRLCLGRRLVCFVWGIAAVLFVGAVGCSEDDPTPFEDVDVVGRDKNPEGVEYPSDDWGMRPRKGGVPGQRVPNFSFSGYPNSDLGGGLQVVSMADYYDPSRQHRKLMWLIAVAPYCPYCQGETRAIVSESAALRDAGVEVVQLVITAVDYRRPLSLEDVEWWISKMGTDFTVLIDANARRLGSVMPLEGVPINIVVDVRSMEVLTVQEWATFEPLEYVGRWVGWVGEHAARE